MKWITVIKIFKKYLIKSSYAVTICENRKV